MTNPEPFCPDCQLDLSEPGLHCPECGWARKPPEAIERNPSGRTVEQIDAAIQRRAGKRMDAATIDQILQPLRGVLEAALEVMEATQNLTDEQEEAQPPELVAAIKNLFRKVNQDENLMRQEAPASSE
jgi:hypothetical protein